MTRVESHCTGKQTRCCIFIRFTILWHFLQVYYIVTFFSDLLYCDTFLFQFSAVILFLFHPSSYQIFSTSFSSSFPFLRLISPIIKCFFLFVHFFTRLHFLTTVYSIFHCCCFFSCFSFFFLIQIHPLILSLQTPTWRIVCPSCLVTQFVLVIYLMCALCCSVYKIQSTFFPPAYLIVTIACFVLLPFLLLLECIGNCCVCSCVLRGQNVVLSSLFGVISYYVCHYVLVYSCVILGQNLVLSYSLWCYLLLCLSLCLTL